MARIVKITVVMAVLALCGSAWADVFDHFDDGVLDPAWGITFDNATGWTYSESGTNITVTDIAIDDPGHSTAAGTFLNQNFYAPSYFEVELSLSWDCDGKNTFIGTLLIELYGGDTVIARAGYYDPWLYHRGAKLAVIGEQSYHTGTNTLPFADSAIVKIQRIAGVITVLWDDTVLFSDNNNQVVDNLKINFHQDRYPGATFGSFSVDYVSASSATLTLSRLEITGPNEVAENSTAQYKAMAYYDNNSTRDVTDSAQWQLSPTTAASIDSNGLLATEEIYMHQEDITVYAQYDEDGNTVNAEKAVSIFAVCPDGSALDFDGDDDYVMAPSSNSLKINNSLTIELWIKPDVDITPALNHFISLVNKHQGGHSGLGYVLQFDNGSGGNRGALRFVVGNGTPHICVGDKDSWSANVWYHVGVSYEPTTDSKNVKFFVNGELDAVMDMKELIGTHDDPLYIGSEIGTWQYFGGVLDEVRIWNIALTEAQMLTLMHSRPGADEPNLVGYWDFNEGEGQVAGDSSGNGNDGHLGNNPDADNSDPTWVDSNAPIGICTPQQLIERNITDAMETKMGILEEIETALLKENAAIAILEELFRAGDYGQLNKNDIVRAKQDIHSAVQHQQQSADALEKSVGKLEEASAVLDVEE